MLIRNKTRWESDTPEITGVRAEDIGLLETPDGKIYQPVKYNKHDGCPRCCQCAFVERNCDSGADVLSCTKHSNVAIGATVHRLSENIYWKEVKPEEE